MNWHWLRHDWSKWQEYTERGTMLVATGFLKYDTAHPQEYVEIRQRRTCATCGRVQDELVA